MPYRTSVGSARLTTYAGAHKVVRMTLFPRGIARRVQRLPYARRDVGSMGIWPVTAAMRTGDEIVRRDPCSVLIVR
jgi:hypothetical protein